MERRGFRCLGLFGVWGGPLSRFATAPPEGELFLDPRSGPLSCFAIVLPEGGAPTGLSQWGSFSD